MNEAQLNIPLLILLFGVVLVIVILIRGGLRKISIPAIVGFMILGFLIRLLNNQTGCLEGGGFEIFEFLAKIGVIAILFRIGLESNIRGLLKQLKSASLVWVGNVAVNVVLGFAVPYYILGIDVIPSMFIAAALTATSVGISVAVWRERNQLDSKNGELLVDVAELDDISGIVLMIILFAVAPQIKGDAMAHIFPTVASAVGIVVFKLVIFGGACLLFSLYLEQRITSFFEKFAGRPYRILVVAGVGFIMAAIAGLLQFSLAIGAFFAGLAFSRDPDSVKLDRSFGPIYTLFGPFFFIGIGIAIEVSSLAGGFGLGLLLFIIAVISKIVGSFPAYFTSGLIGAVLIGFSMVPRAEIAMIIMQHGRNQGDWAVGPDIYTAMVLVSIMTCIISPIVVGRLLDRWPQK